MVTVKVNTESQPATVSAESTKTVSIGIRVSDTRAIASSRL